MLTETASAWLSEQRQIEPELAVRLGVTSSAKGSGGERLAIPFVVAGKVVNHKHRPIGEKRFWMDEGGELVFWNFDVIADPSLADQPLVITEGEFDAMISIQAGWLRSVSVPNGSPEKAIEDHSAARYAFVEHAWEALKSAKEIIIAADNDAAGMALLTDLTVRLGAGRCKFLTYPYDKGKTRRLKDLNEVQLVYGDRGVEQTLRGAKWCNVTGIGRMSDMPPRISPPAMSTGFPFLDRHYKIRLGDFCVVTGIPSMGKSSWLNDLACRVTDLHGWVICFASFEQDPQSDHKRALREWYLEQTETTCSESELIRADEWIDDRFAFIKPEDDDLPDLKWIIERIATVVTRYNAKLVIIDPWNEIEHVRDRQMSETEYVGFAIRQLKALAKRLNVHLIVAAHTTKIELNAEGKYPMPGLYQIAGSANWYNKPDVGIVIHRFDRQSSFTCIAVEKVRYHEAIGEEGIVWTSYDRYRRRYSEAVAPDEVEAARNNGRRQGQGRR